MAARRARVLTLFLLGCNHPATKPDDTDATAEDTGLTTPSPDWCDRVTTGPAAAKDVAVALSEAHAALRFFGPGGSLAEADDTLVAALATGVETPDLDAYAALDGTCVLDATEGTLGAASVELVGDVAVVTPGTGAVTLPEGAAAVAIDLRGLPDVPELDDALVAAVSPALATDLPRAARTVRVWSGMVDQVYTETNIYDVDKADVTPDPIVATGAADLPLTVLTDARMPPAAAELAGTLKMTGRGAILGEDVLSAVAEAHWDPVDTRGLAWRAEALLDDAGSEWPDTIPADVRTDDPVAAAADLATRGAPAEVPAGESTRPKQKRMNPWGDYSAAALDADALRAALLVAHGSARRFFPYFDVVGDGIDDRLLETLAAVPDAPSRDVAADLLGRFGNVLSDGHMFVWDYEQAEPAGCFLVSWDHDAEGLPVAYDSLNDAVRPGDTLLSIDGEPIADWYDAALAVVGGATDGYARNLASRRLTYLDEGSVLVLRDADGVERTETIALGSCDDAGSLLWGATDRAHGWLDDLGAPDLYYVNLGYEVATDDNVDAALAEAATAAGVVVDMRGYPSVDQYAVARALIAGTFSSPRFDTPTWTGPDGLSVVDDVYTFDGDGLVTAPMVLLVGPRTVSAAENFSMMLVAAGRVTVVGRNSAGTNGNITGLRTPGDLGMSFTGMDLLWPDGSSFHGEGIAPDVEVPLDPAALAIGRDDDLAAAIEVLTGAS